MKREANRRAAARLAGGHVIRKALRFNDSYRHELSDRDQLIDALGDYVAESLCGFRVDFDSLLETDLAKAHERACLLMRHRHGCSTRAAQQRATEYLRHLWKKTERYLSQPKVRTVLDELFDEAVASKRSEWSLMCSWKARAVRVPDFDAAVTRAAESDRKIMIELTRRALDEMTAEDRAA